MKKFFSKTMSRVAEKLTIKIHKIKGQYAGEFFGYEFRGITTKDSESFYQTMNSPQYFGVSETDFLLKFLLNQSRKDEFEASMGRDFYRRRYILETLTDHMNAELIDYEV